MKRNQQWHHAKRARTLREGARNAVFAAALLAGSVFGDDSHAPATPGPVAKESWLPAAAQAIKQSCATRQLALKWPVRVRPMAEYGAGYTPGIGSITWQAHHTEIWRTGWCAVGIYCTPAKPVRNAEVKRFEAPQGLYSHRQGTIYIREPRADVTTAATVAHEAVHALQFQNFPDLAAAHLWFNRDLNTAVEAVAEGDAHLVGWSFEADRRRHLCSMDVRQAAHLHRDWWHWAPHQINALESFPHVFGPEFVLSRRLRDAGAPNALLRFPPLSTLAVLRPDRAGPVDFISLPSKLADTVARNTGKTCVEGLANTVGVVGIWGLLAHADATVAGKLPDFLLDWAGDRFVHLRCDIEDERGLQRPNDELAWLTRWRTSAAAKEFARRFKGLAADAAKRGGVLGAPAKAMASGGNVIVTTPGLKAARRAILRSRRDQFADYRSWITGGCLPEGNCQQSPMADAPAQGEEGFTCGAGLTIPPTFDDWLRRMRAVRAMATAAKPETLAPALVEVGRQAVFCTINARRNADLLAGCRAMRFGVRYLAALADNAHWRWLPLCANGDGFRAQLRQWLVEPAKHRRFDPRHELNLGGAALVAAAFANGGAAQVRRLAAAPPLSTLHLLDAEFRGAVDFLHLPRGVLQAHGCELLATDVVGAWALWAMLAQLETPPTAVDLPPVLRAWRGDREWYVRCGERQGWIWASRWANNAAARDFATGYAAAVPPTIPGARHAEVDGRTVWFAPKALGEAKALAKTHLRSRTFATFGEWRTAGCYPQLACD